VYSLYLTCEAGQADHLSAELWEAGTEGIRELDYGDSVRLIAGFATNENRAALLAQFAAYAPEWEHEDDIDWVEETKAAWPPREVGARFFLAPPWSIDPTPPGRERIIHNPGLACGTGEHPCTQLALMALEQCLSPGSTVADIGTGSGILSIGALRLGAETAIGIDIDTAALQAARENFELNRLPANLVAGSADCLATECADVVVANINATVLLSMLDELLRITCTGGWLILTGFTEAEVEAIALTLTDPQVLALNEWRCVVAKIF